MSVVKRSAAELLPVKDGQTLTYEQFELLAFPVMRSTVRGSVLMGRLRRALKHLEQAKADADAVIEEFCAMNRGQSPGPEHKES